MPGQLQQEILDMVARGVPIEETAEHICRYAEQHAEGVLCSIVTIDRGGLIHPLAGPSISSGYSAALDGIPIGPSVGSCGTAAFLRKPIAVADISTDPLWAPYQALAKMLGTEHGVKACWSSPILQSDTRVLGAFGFYYRENRGPTPEEERIVADCIDLCALALEREDIRAENERLAYFDLLTGLGNRANFIKTLENSVEWTDTALAILLIDVDYLGRINDTCGHATGDRIIREVGRIVAKAASKTSEIFRIDADEFAIIIKSTDPIFDLSRTAVSILQAMEEYSFRRKSNTMPLSVSCGGALLHPSQLGDSSVFLQYANLALHHAKQTARGSYVLYSEDLASKIAQRFHVLQSVTSALAENRIEAHYQPIVRLDTREIVGLEALCRIRTREGKIIAAGQFADAIQDLSMGSYLTDQMLEQVARDLRSWLDRQIPLGHVGINVSMADFNKRNLYDRIIRIFSRYGTPLKHVVLEVTESVYMNESDHDVAQSIRALRADGIRIALDDFGTGYASLTHLLDFPIDIVKIDKSFVDRMAGGGAGEIIIRALLEMTERLGMQVIAEGVESDDQAARLKHYGCELAQGYLFGRAVSCAEVTARLQRQERQTLS